MPAQVKAQVLQPIDEADTKTQAIVAMHNGGLSTRKIETIIGDLDHVTIARRLKKLTPRKTTEIYKELRADVLAEKERQLLMQAQHAAPREQDQISRAFKVYHEAERLTRDQSTSNIEAHVDLTDRLRDALKRAKEAREAVLDK